MLIGLTSAGPERLSLFKYTKVPLKEFYFNQSPVIVLYYYTYKEKTIQTFH